MVPTNLTGRDLGEEIPASISSLTFLSPMDNFYCLNPKYTRREANLIVLIKCKVEKQVWI